MQLTKNELLFEKKLYTNNELKNKIQPFHNPYSFSFPASPHLAAKAEKRKIKIKRIQESIDYFKPKTDYLLIEGVGGLMVPLTHEILLIDLLKKERIPVVLVVNNVLGCINKTLLSLYALKKYNIKIIGLIFNNYFNENRLIQKNNQITIQNFSSIPILGKINTIRTKADLLNNFHSIGEKI